MKISIIIPNYNGKKLLEKNLSEVIKQAKEAEIIVVDDASRDESVDFLKENFPQVKVIRKAKNEGFASTVNQGVKEASGDLVYLLNSDIRPEKNFLKFLIPHFENNKVVAVGSLQKCEEKGRIALRGRGEGKFNRGFLVHKRGEVDKKDTLWVSAGAGMFRKSTWLLLGGMSPLYNPFYWEDIDISYRAQKAGYKVLFEPKSVLVHRQDEGAIRNTFTAFQIKSIAYRNQIIFVWLNITDFGYSIKHLFYLQLQLLKSLLSSDFTYWKGYFLFILKLPEVIWTRLNNKKLFIKSDEEVLRSFSK